MRRDLRHRCSAPGSGGKGEAGRAGDARRRSRRGERQRAHDDPPRQFDLERIVAGRLCVGERRLRGAAERGRRPGAAPASISSAARARHGFAATPPSASRASTIVPCSIRKRRGGRHDGEGVGGAFADLQIARMRRERRAPRPAAAPRRSDRRARARFRARACRRAGGAGPRARSRAGRCCPRSRRRHRARPAARRNPTDGWRCRLRSSRARRAVGSRRRAHRSPRPARACCRRWRCRRNTRIASAAADCRRRSRHCEAAPTRRTAAPRRPRDRTSGEIRIMREIGIAHQRADANAAIGQTFDPVEPRQARDVDETVRTADAALHQVEQIGAGGEIGGAGLGGGRDGLGDRSRA